MERLLHGCTALEYLRLQAINGLSTFHITSMTLRTIYVCCWFGRKTSQDVYHGMVIEDTPALERLLVLDQVGPTRITVSFYAEIDSGGLLVCQILRTCYWIHTRSGTTVAFYLSFYKLTLFLILKMFVHLSFRK